MTAYGSAESSKDGLEFIVELRSVNYRYREIILRLSQGLQPFEEKIRSMVSDAVKRGRIEVSIQIKDNGDKDVELELNRPLVKTYINLFNDLNEEIGGKQPIDLSLFSQLKDIIIPKHDTIDYENVWPDLENVIREALLSMESMRVNEGKVLEQDFLKRLERITKYIDEIRMRSKEVIASYSDKLRKKINNLIQSIEINEDRLLQEIAIMADRSDITEELIRVESHLAQFRNFMNLDDVIGRRLDFLLQEINREVNTMGAKAADFLVSQCAVEIKAELEKLREQIQNVE